MRKGKAVQWVRIGTFRQNGALVSQNVTMIVAKTFP